MADQRPSARHARTGSRLLLVGMMGAGKTTVGRIVARHLGWSYLDSDEMVERATGHSVAELWAEHGEAGFRGEESRVLADALSRREPSVVSVAGGAVLDPANRRLLREAGTVVWLRAGVDTLTERLGRLGESHGRPLLEGDPAVALARLEAERRPLYEEVADRIVDVEGRSAAAVAQQVLEALASPAGPGSAPARQDRSSL